MALLDRAADTQVYANVAKQYLSAAAEGSSQGISVKQLYNSIQRRHFLRVPEDASTQVAACSAQTSLCAYEHGFLFLVLSRSA